VGVPVFTFFILSAVQSAIRKEEGEDGYANEVTANDMIHAVRLYKELNRMGILDDPPPSSSTPDSGREPAEPPEIAVPERTADHVPTPPQSVSASDPKVTKFTPGGS
ncbi:MAG: hypothetical protein AAFN43_12360, partial [Pseudomonadota bacterium]